MAAAQANAEIGENTAVKEYKFMAEKGAWQHPAARDEAKKPFVESFIYGNTYMNKAPFHLKVWYNGMPTCLGRLQPFYSSNSKEPNTRN